MGKLAVIIGPTGVGKTELSLRLAERWKCPIVNCDSRQIYKELPIGTAAPTEEECKRVKHYFVGTHSLHESYNAGQYAREAVALLASLSSQATENRPFAILSGGSMLYLDAVCYGLDDIPSTDSYIREQLQHQYQQYGIQWLQEQVKKADPDYYTEADCRNPQRLLHCLEVTLSAGKPYSSFRTRKRENRPWETIYIGLMREREELYKRINQRVNRMMAQGLETEARKAYEQLRNPSVLPNALNTVGYREMVHFIRGDWSREEVVRMIQQNSRHYAKRQMTWFRKRNDIHWIQMNQPIETIVEQIETFL